MPILSDSVTLYLPYNNENLRLRYFQANEFFKSIKIFISKEKWFF